jgi:DNA polymerase I-like protein with 3'-5' exonuclease and polymerase domains
MWNQEKSVEIVTNSNRLDELLDYYLQAEYLAFDTETDGLSRFTQPIGISFSPNTEEGIYIPIRIWKDNTLVSPWKTQESLQKVKDFCYKLLTSKKRLILHNAVFDIKVIANWLGVNISEYVHCDTMLLAHTVHNEEGPMGLKDLAGLLLDPNALNPKDEVKESVKANGGQTSQKQFDFYKCDYKILGTYAVYDTIYTYGLFEVLYPKLEGNLLSLWENEVMALLPVSYELNTAGIAIDVPYFENLRDEMKETIKNLEDEIYASIESGDSLIDYEIERIKKKTKITERSELGKLLLGSSESLELDTPSSKELARKWFRQKNDIHKIFNIDSNDDLAYLMYDVLGIPCEKTTDSGKRSVTASVLDEIGKAHEESSPIIKLLLRRKKEIKMLSTYVEPFLERNIDGRLYPDFKQTGTTSGRYSSANPNFQNLPAGDMRIRKGVIPDKGSVIIDADYSSLEPRSFSIIADEPTIQQIYRDDLDFYSQVYITVMQATEYSAKEGDPNFLKDVAPKLRQSVKGWALGFAYGMTEFKLAKMMGIGEEEAKELKERYFNAYPNLLKYHKETKKKLKRLGYVENIVGRRKRARITHSLYSNGIKDFMPWDLKNNMRKIERLTGMKDSREVYKTLGNEERNAYNFQIQSLAASIVNRAMIDFQRRIREEGLDAKIWAQVHDQISVISPIDQSERCAKILQECMENNEITRKLPIPMIAEPKMVSKWSDAK